MKKRILTKFLISMVVAIVITFMCTTEVQAADYSNEFSFNNNSAVHVDGNFSEWNSLPASYEYNWDNSQNCWDYGVWVDGVCYKTAPGTYNTDVRHKVQMYCDGANVYLHIVFSRDYGSKFCGENYCITIDGQQTSFAVRFNNGGVITDNLNGHPVSTIPVSVIHERALSGQVVDNSQAFLKVNDNNVNNEIELKIPLSEIQRQNGNINIDTMSTLEFTCPNLMYRSVASAGTPVGTELLIVIVSVIAIGGFTFQRKRGVI